MLSPVSTQMGDSLQADIQPQYVAKPTRSTQPCITLGLLNWIPALTGWGKGKNITSAGWQITLCDPIWHTSSYSSETSCKLLYAFTLSFTFITEPCQQPNTSTTYNYWIRQVSLDFFNTSVPKLSILLGQIKYSLLNHFQQHTTLICFHHQVDIFLCMVL